MATIRKDNPDSADPDYTFDTDDEGHAVWLVVNDWVLYIDGGAVEVYNPDDEAAIVSGRPVQLITLGG